MNSANYPGSFREGENPQRSKAFQNATDNLQSTHRAPGLGVVNEALQSLALQSFQALSKPSHALVPSDKEEASGVLGYCGDPTRLLDTSGRIVQTQKRTG